MTLVLLGQASGIVRIMTMPKRNQSPPFEAAFARPGVFSAKTVFHVFQAVGIAPDHA